MRLSELKRLLALAYRAGVVASLKQVILAIKQNRPIDLALVNAAIQAMSTKAWQLQAAMAEGHFRFVLGENFVNLNPLAAQLRELARLHNERMGEYQYLFQQNSVPNLFIGRRGQDIIREISLNTIEDAFLRGKGALALKDQISRELIAKGRADLAELIAQGYDIKDEILKAVPVFSEDGRPHFWLKNKNDKFMKFEVEHYAELVASTTTEEADRMANVEKARAIGTRLVVFNKTGKGRAFYLETKDLRCAAVDGQIFSIEESGTIIDGIRFAYWRDVLPGPYTTCHPFCEHFMRPISEAVAVARVREAA
jgi:hypothetical protein